MKEIIVKRDDDINLSLEIVGDNFLRVNLTECGCDNQFMDFALEEIDDLQEAISIMKDRLKRNLLDITDKSDKKSDKVSDTEQKVVKNVSNNEQKVEEKLTYGGEIADFPIEVVEKMLEMQVEQGNKRDVRNFEYYKAACASGYGFNWRDTIEQYSFWHEVINNKNFNLFFERYPKK